MRILLALLVLLCFLPVSAEVPNCQDFEATEAAPAQAELERIRFAQQLIAQGRQNQDPLPLIVAAEQLRGSTLLDAEAGSDPLAFLKEAEGWAQGNSYLLERIRGARSSSRDVGFAGPTPAWGTRDLDIGSSWEVKREFTADKVAAVEISGDAPLGIVVFDDAGHRVAMQKSSGKSCSAQWKPRHKGQFRILVTNLGGSKCTFSVAML